VDSCFHVSPPSVDLNKPVPGPVNCPFSHGPWRAAQSTPYTIRGFTGSNCTSIEARVSRPCEDLLPGLAAIEGPVQPALLIGSVWMAEHSDEHPVRVLGIDHHLADLLPVAEPHVPPGFPAVRRLVETVADRKVRPLQAFAAADVDDIRIRLRNRQCAHGARRLVVKKSDPRSGRNQSFARLRRD